MIYTEQLIFSVKKWNLFNHLYWGKTQFWISKKKNNNKLSSWLMKSNISVSIYSVRVNIIIIIYGGLLKFSLRMVFLVVCFLFFLHFSKIQCINTFYEIVLIPFIKLKTSNKLHIKLIKFFKQNFIFIPLCFKDVMLKWSFVGIRYEK